MTDGIDIQAPTVDEIDPRNLSIEELQAAIAQMEGDRQQDEPDPLEDLEQPDENAEEGEEPAGEETGATESAQSFVIDGETYTADQLKELVSKGQDYTRKTQQLAEERKEIQARAEVFDAWEKHPQTRPLIVQHFANQLTPEERAMIGIGVTNEAPTEYQAPEGIDLNELTDNERAIHLAGQREIQALKAQLKEAVPVLGALKEHLARQAQAEQESLAAQAAAKTIEAEYGLTGVTPDSIRAAMKQTGLSDPEAAWLKLNAKALMTAGVRKGVEQVVKDKPNAPGKSTSKTFDPMEKNPDGTYKYSPDQAAKLLERGWKPVL